MPPEPKHHDPVRLTTACVISGQYFAAGVVLPFQAEHEVPPNLRHLIATDEDDIPPPPVVNIYGQQPGPEPGGAVLYQQTGGASQWRQARQVNAGMEQQAWAEAEAERAGSLPPETQEVLETEHARHIAKLKAQAEYNAKAVDATYEAAVQEAEGRTVQQFVRRGGEWAKVQNAKLKAGENVFVRRENGAMEASGCVDSRGEPPDSEISL